jgi:hypothetical protein
MGQSGGTGIKEIDNFSKDPLGAAANLYVNVVSGGYLSYEDGKLGRGALGGRMLDEGLGEITGRNLAREEAGKADARVNAEAAARAQDRKDQLAQAEADDRTASFQARGSRNSAIARSRSSALRFNPLGSDEKDFLGL